MTRTILPQGPPHARPARRRAKLEVDSLRALPRQLARLGNEHRDGLADVTGTPGGEHPPRRQRRVVDRRLDLQRFQVFKIRGGPGGYHPRRVPRRLEVEPGNGRVREMTSREDGMQATGRLDIVDITSRATNQAWVFDPTNGGTEDGGRHFDECILAVNGQP